ncbi:unnamed protein product, partial [Ectocarpus sp. 12 AP-2014]
MSSSQDNNHEINGPSSGHSSSLILRKNCDRCTVKKMCRPSRQGGGVAPAFLKQSKVLVRHQVWRITPSGEVIDHTGRGSKTHPEPTWECGSGGRILVHPSNDVGAAIGHAERRNETHPQPMCEGGHGGRIIVLLSNDVGAAIDHAGRWSKSHPNPTCDGGSGGCIVFHLSNGT